MIDSKKPEGAELDVRLDKDKESKRSNNVSNSDRLLALGHDYDRTYQPINGVPR